MERDDIIEYSLHAHHSEEEGKKIGKGKNFPLINFILFTTDIKFFLSKNLFSG